MMDVKMAMTGHSGIETVVRTRIFDEYWLQMVDKAIKAATYKTKKGELVTMRLTVTGDGHTHSVAYLREAVERANAAIGHNLWTAKLWNAMRVSASGWRMAATSAQGRARCFVVFGGADTPFGATDTRAGLALADWADGAALLAVAWLADCEMADWADRDASRDDELCEVRSDKDGRRWFPHPLPCHRAGEVAELLDRLDSPELFAPAGDRLLRSFAAWMIGRLHA